MTYGGCTPVAPTLVGTLTIRPTDGAGEGNALACACSGRKLGRILMFSIAAVPGTVGVGTGTVGVGKGLPNESVVTPGKLSNNAVESTGLIGGIFDIAWS